MIYGAIRTGVHAGKGRMIGSRFACGADIFQGFSMLFFDRGYKVVVVVFDDLEYAPGTGADAWMIFTFQAAVGVDRDIKITRTIGIPVIGDHR